MTIWNGSAGIRHSRRAPAGADAGSVRARRACAHSLFAHLSTHAQPPPLFAPRISLTWELLTSSCFTRAFILLHRRQRPHVMIISSDVCVIGVRVTLWYENWGYSACTVMFRDVVWWKLSDDQIDTVIGILLTDKRKHGRCAGEWSRTFNYS